MAARIFIDTMYVVALINENDEYHKIACELSEKHENSSFVTTDAVLLEIANALARNYKEQAVEIVHLNPALFEKAFQRYKMYLTDARISTRLRSQRQAELGRNQCRTRDTTGTRTP